MVFCNVLPQISRFIIMVCHNPYFNRWFSAIMYNKRKWIQKQVTILILIDGFLQLAERKYGAFGMAESQSLF